MGPASAKGYILNTRQLSLLYFLSTEPSMFPFTKYFLNIDGSVLKKYTN